MARPMRVVVISDKHHGSISGLTPPSWDSLGTMGPTHLHEYHRLRRAVWEWFEQTVGSLGRVDVVVDNGDLIDGKGKRSGGTEIMWPDRNDQVEMATWTLETMFPHATKFLSYGTPYHTGEEEDWERAVATNLGCQIGSEDTIDVRGLHINFKHQTSRSVIPHGRFTPIARDKLWNTLWALRGEYPSADVLIRSHVHYFNFCGDLDWLALSTPAMQGYGSKYGARRMTGVVDVGFLVFDVTSRTEYTWRPYIWRAPFNPPTEVVVAEPTES